MKCLKIYESPTVIIILNMNLVSFSSSFIFCLFTLLGFTYIQFTIRAIQIRVEILEIHKIVNVWNLGGLRGDPGKCENNLNRSISQYWIFCED